MRRSALLTLPALLLMVVACSPRPVERPFRTRNYTSIISLGPGITEILTSQTDAGQRVRGRTAADNWPANTINAIPVVASVKPDHEKIAGIKPDLIVYDAALFSQADIDKLKSVAPEATVFAISANTVAEFERQLFELGSLLGSEIRVNDYVIKIDAARARAATNSENAKPLNVAVVMPGESGGDFIAGTGSFVADTVRVAGGTPIGPDAPVFVALNGEALAGFNPDVIIVPGKKGDVTGAISVLNNPAYKATNAVKLGNIKAIDQDVLLRRGGRVDVLIDAVSTILGTAKR